VPGTALITGITGQDGTYLAQLLLSKGYNVYGLVRGQNNPRLDMVGRLCPGIEFIEGDLLDHSSLVAALEGCQPTEVYNLGAISFVGLSFKQALLTATANGAYDPAKIQALANQQAQLQAAITVQHEALKHQIYTQVLTSEQQAKAEQLRTQEINRITEHLQKMANGTDAPPPSE